MFCMKCGAELSSNTKFCQSCGTPVEVQDTLTAMAQHTADTMSQMDSGKENPAPQADPAPQAAPAHVKKPKGSMSKATKGIIAGAAALLVVLAVVLTLVLTAPKKINLSEYLDVYFSGYDSYGEANVSLDRWSLYSDLVGERADSAEGLDRVWKNAEKYNNLGNLIDGIRWEVEPYGDLSNGDVITIAMTYDEELAKNQKIKFIEDTLEVTVEDLDAITSINPFDGLEVTFEGISPEGEASVSYEGEMSDTLRYEMEVSQYSDLSNGDTITISFDGENLGRYYGIKLTETERSYEVTGLAEYIGGYADISENDLAVLQQEAEDTIYAYTASNYSSASSISDLQFAGYILQTAKPGETVGYENVLHLIFKANLSNSEGKFYGSEIYYPVCYRDLVISEGNLSFESKSDVEGYSDLDGGGWWGTDGYRNPYTCYRELAEANRDSYTIKCGGGFENFESNTPIGALADLSEQCRTELQEEAKAYIESYIAKEYSDRFATSELSFAGEYLLTAKTQGTDYGENNRYYAVFTATVTQPEDEDFEPVTIYYPVGFFGLVNLPDGAYMVTSHDGISGGDDIPGTWSWSKGYMSGAEMFTQLITANRDLYTYEVTEGLKVFGE